MDKELREVNDDYRRRIDKLANAAMALARAVRCIVKTDPTMASEVKPMLDDVLKQIEEATWEL